MSQDPELASMTPEQLHQKADELLDVKPVKPIVTDDPKDVIQKLREELVKERANHAATAALAKAVQEERDRSDDALCDIRRAVDAAKKRIGTIAAERDHLVLQCRSLAQQVDAQKADKIVAMIDERQKLRTDVGHKDKQIADLTRKVDAAQAQVEASRTFARQAEQRAGGMEASLEAMQAARDTAQAERAAAVEKLAAEKRLHENATAAAVVLIAERDGLQKRIAELVAAGKAKTVVVPMAKGA